MQELWHWYVILFPSPGLRTLCFAVTDISESNYQQWLEIHHRACTSLQNRALKMEESYELIEKVSLVKCWEIRFMGLWNEPLLPTLHILDRLLYLRLNWGPLWKRSQLCVFSRERFKIWPAGRIKFLWLSLCGNTSQTQKATVITALLLAAQNKWRQSIMKWARKLSERKMKWALPNGQSVAVTQPGFEAHCSFGPPMVDYVLSQATWGHNGVAVKINRRSVFFLYVVSPKLPICDYFLCEKI